MLVDSRKNSTIIAEDVILAMPDTKTSIGSIAGGKGTIGIVKLMNHRTNMFRTISTIEHYISLGCCITGPQGSAVTYLVAREGAERLLEKLTRMELPWDIALKKGMVARRADPLDNYEPVRVC